MKKSASILFNLRKLNLIVWLSLAAFGLISCQLPQIRLPHNPLTQLLTGRSGRIAYIGADGNIYTIRADGNGKIALTQDAFTAADSNGQTRIYRYPTWSPGGELLAFVGVNQTGRDLDAASLYLAQPDGGKQIEVFHSEENFPIYLYWSPDGQTLSFLSTLGRSNRLVLQFVSAQGGAVRVVDRGEPYFWVWSPDNQGILVHVGGSAIDMPDAHISFLRLDGEVHEQRLEMTPSHFQSPAWSPDGEHLLMAAYNEEGEDFLVLTDQSGVIEKTLAEVEKSINFAWSPAGDRLAYVTGDFMALPVPHRLMIILDPEQPGNAFILDEQIVLSFFWSPDGKKIAYIVPNHRLGVDEAIRFGDKEEPSVFLKVWDLDSGETRIVAELKPSSEFIYLMSFFDQYNHSSTIWSPDNQSLVIPVDDGEGAPDILVVDAMGQKESRVIAEGTLAFWSWK